MRPSFSSCREEQVILGGLLGDGSLKIHPGYKNARYSFRHCVKQKEYFEWKMGELKRFSSEKCFWDQPGEKEALGGDMLRYQSLALKELTDYHLLTHKGNKKVLSRKWLNRLGPLGLAIWWLDDGSIVGNGRKGVLCTDGFSLKEIETIVKYLRVVWGVNARYFPVSQDRPGQYRLALFSEELQKFFRIILPELPRVRSMLYKVLLLYRDPELQQRWISEVSEATGFTEAELQALVNERKSKLKHFRK